METFCITALEAAASETLVVTNDLAALRDTVGSRGVVIPGDPRTIEWREKAIDKLMDTLGDKDKVREVIEKNQ